MRAEASDSEAQAHGAVFATTHWSVVLAAGQQDTPQSTAALEELCRTYWYPLYAYVRRRGYSPEDAQDLTQEFFARLLARQCLSQADRRRGRFRSFLLSSLNHFLIDEWHKVRTQKRGGTQPILSLDELDPEARYRLEPADPADADRLYERRWAMTLLDRVLARLQEELTAAGRQDLFNQVLPFLLGEKTGRTYAEVAATLGSTEGALKMSVHRMRERYQELAREEIAQTVSRPEEVEEEIRHLRSVLSS